MAAAGGGGNIKVVVRVRPFNGRELERNAKCIVSMQDSQTVLTPSVDARAKGNKAIHDGVKTFAFDKSYWSFDRKDEKFAGQDDLFADLGRPLLDNAFKGYNNCIFAYGQTGSGKSYSMMGYGAEEGVIPKICRDMFGRIEGLQQDPNQGCTVEVSYLEIYNERVRDLLNPSTKGNLKVREHPSTGPYVEDLAKLVVRSFAEIENLMDEGNKARTVAATNMNETSSRSHAVFTLTLTQRRHDVETSMDTEKVAKISLVDLAGSERATSTGATGARLKEGAEINRSLSTLGRVIAALADLSTGKKKNASMVPYRDSVLTWLLKDSLGGNSLTAMIAAISPADINFEETLSTLRYADSAKRIKNHAVVNEDPNARMIRELKEELAQLRSKLTGGGSAGVQSQEQYPSGTPLAEQFVSIVQADGSIKKVSKADIAEQLDQSEKLYQDLNQTWEQKLQKTEQIHKEREAALEELGISIEKGFVGLSTPKKMPHLVNLSDDPLLAECLIYNLKPGVTMVGNVDTAQSAEIRLNGSKILHEHCTFENENGIVTLAPRENAAVMVNGVRIEHPKRLRSGYRIILGDFHIFRFNHPQEARAERAEQGSLLKHSVAADEISSPSLRPGHDRSSSSVSRHESDFEGDGSRFGSPSPYPRNDGESDWNFARKEAISAVLGPDQKMSTLTDDELEVLFDDLQRVRAVRRGRPESRLFDTAHDDDSESNASFAFREKYLSNGTLDNFSLDTALTIPSTPQMIGEDERLRSTREDMQGQLQKQKADLQTKLQSAEMSNMELDALRAEKTRMEETLRSMKEDMVKQLETQKSEYDLRLASLRKPGNQPEDANNLTGCHLELAKRFVRHWRRQRYVAMARSILETATLLKEAQVMSQQMDRNVVFQFAILDAGHTFDSSYDLVLNSTSTEDDPALESSPKPCVAVRVIDFKYKVAHHWSLQKLAARVRIMRQMHQYLDRPEYVKHFRLDNPFLETCLPEYTPIGHADIPLAAVFECKVQDFTLDVYSPYTFTVVAMVHLSLEPSPAEAPPSTLKFNVVMHDLVGFPEREGTQVHAQLFFPGISEEDGATTTQMVDGFDEAPVRFDSVHSLSVSMNSPPDSTLRIALFAKVQPMHFDKLLSWDDMRDSSNKPRQKSRKARLGEHQYLGEQKHDIFVRVQILEIGEDGTYQPVEVVQNGVLDNGAYQLRQGLQRRIVVDLNHQSGAFLQWQDVVGARIGNIHLLDSSGNMPDLGNTEDSAVPLSLVAPPLIRAQADGSTNVKFVANWDSGTHNSLLLDRPTAENFRVRLTLTWAMSSKRLGKALELPLTIAVQMRSRVHVRQTSFFSQLWSTQRIVHSSTGVFSLAARPLASRKAGDLWRLNAQENYVKGEESLNGWAPRGVSLVRDFLEARKKRLLAAEVDRVRRWLQSSGNYDAITDTAVDGMELDPSDSQRLLLSKVLEAWIATPDASSKIIQQSNTDAPESGAPATSMDVDDDTKMYVATARFIPKNPTMLRYGHLYVPNTSHTQWERRYLELRQPYIHIHASPSGDEIGILNLTGSRIDHEPQLDKILQRAGDGRQYNAHMNVFAVYTATKAWLFASKTHIEKVEWILAIDRSYFSSEGSVTPEDGGYD